MAVHQLEANIDDMDPRLWPGVLDALLTAGALDAWLVPITMKKGHPAFTLCALADDAAVDAVGDTMFAETTTIGLRHHEVGRRVLPRTTGTVSVDGATIATKTSRLDDHRSHTSVEWDDVRAAAEALGLSARDVLAAATAAAHADGASR